MALRLDYAGRAPLQASEGAAGLDLYADADTIIPGSSIVLVGTGTKVSIPSGFFGLLAIRSSLGAKGISLANGIGIIDSDYRGEVKVAIHNLMPDSVTLPEGIRIAQLVVVPFATVSLHEVCAFDVTERGEGGFGSTGRT